MKKIISMVLSFILILGCSTTAFAAETHNYDTENLPHDGADYFETEIKADEENEERISDFVTVYGYQYTKGSLKSGAWRNGTSGGSSTSSAKLSLNYTQDTSYNISFKASVSGGYTNGGKLKFEIYDDYTKTNITRDQMAKKTAEVKQKIAEIESLITEKQETLDMQKDLFLDAKQEQLTKLSKLDEFDEEVIRYLIDYVLVYDNEHIEIRWNFDDFQAG